MTDGEKQQRAQKFLSLLGNPDEGVLRSVAVEDVVWPFPGRAQSRARRTESLMS
jgi:hypothetical protein